MMRVDILTQTGTRPWVTGGGVVEPAAEGLRLALPASAGQVYADAQISDYHGLPRRAFPWCPPLRLTVHACASSDGLAGTAGFGFWNDPFLPGRRALPRLPRALWFFYAGPGSNMALASGVPGSGWKAAVFDAGRPLFWGLVPFVLPGFLLMRIPALYRLLWPIGQRALGVAEAALPVEQLARSHEYVIEWREDRVTFGVDQSPVLATRRSPRGPLGFIAWIDNQYAVVTPQGQFNWGVTANPAQALVLEKVIVELL